MKYVLALALLATTAHARTLPPANTGWEMLEQDGNCSVHTNRPNADGNLFMLGGSKQHNYLVFTSMNERHEYRYGPETSMSVGFKGQVAWFGEAHYTQGKDFASFRMAETSGPGIFQRMFMTGEPVQVALKYEPDVWTYPAAAAAVGIQFLGCMERNNPRVGKFLRFGLDSFNP